MAGLRFTDVPSRSTEFLDWTSVTLDEFQALVPSFEAAFQAHMVAWCLDGTPRTARRFPVYQHCLLPTPEDRLLFLLAYLKTYVLPMVQGACAGWVRVKPTNGCTSCCRLYWRLSAPWAIPPPAP